MSWRRAAWALPIVLFLATFGVFGVRHPGSVRAMLGSVRGVAMTGAVVVVVVVFLLAARLRPAIQRVAPFVLALGVVGGAVYAEVPFERSSTQNRVLVHDPAPVVARPVAGQLRGINHSASGSVTVVADAAGNRVLRFESFHVQGAPAPVLYVAEGSDVQSPAGENLGAFTATDGDTLDIALPAGIEPGAGWTVLIWCERFATPIANATLA
jgi:hypothetical protein